MSSMYVSVYISKQTTKWINKLFCFLTLPLSVITQKRKDKSHRNFSITNKMFILEKWIIKKKTDWHAPYTLSRGNPLKFTSFRNIHSWICAVQRLHARTSVTSYTSVNIYNLNSRLAHLCALWMEYIRSLRTGIMVEYPVMSTSYGTCVRIEQTSEALRVTDEICKVGGGGSRTGIENRCSIGKWHSRANIA